MRSNKQELWIGFLDGGNCKGKVGNLRKITFYITINHMRRIVKINERRYRFILRKQWELRNYGQKIVKERFIFLLVIKEYFKITLF